VARRRLLNGDNLHSSNDITSTSKVWNTGQISKLQSTFEIVHVELRWLSDAEHADTSANGQASSPHGPCYSSRSRHCYRLCSSFTTTYTSLPSQLILQKLMRL
jgi:hypothetical protein